MTDLETFNKIFAGADIPSRFEECQDELIDDATYQLTVTNSEQVGEDNAYSIYYFDKNESLVAVGHFTLDEDE